MRSPLLSSTVKALELNSKAPMPSQCEATVKVKKKTRESILSWQRLQRMHLVRGERNE